MDLKVFHVKAYGKDGKFTKRMLRFPDEGSFKKYAESVKKMFGMKIILDR